MVKEEEVVEVLVHAAVAGGALGEVAQCPGPQSDPDPKPNSSPTQVGNITHSCGVALRCFGGGLTLANGRSYPGPLPRSAGLPIVVIGRRSSRPPMEAPMDVPGRPGTSPPPNSGDDGPGPGAKRACMLAV